MRNGNTTTRQPRPARVRVAGELISANELYSLDAIKVRLHLDTAALRTCRLAGLRVLRIGRRGYVLGSDFIEWAREHSQRLAEEVHDADE